MSKFSPKRLARMAALAFAAAGMTLASTVPASAAHPVDAALPARITVSLDPISTRLLAQGQTRDVLYTLSDLAYLTSPVTGDRLPFGLIVAAIDDRAALVSAQSSNGCVRFAGTYVGGAGNRAYQNITVSPYLNCPWAVPSVTFG